MKWAVKDVFATKYHGHLGQIQEKVIEAAEEVIERRQRDLQRNHVFEEQWPPCTREDAPNNRGYIQIFEDSDLNVRDPHFFLLTKSEGTWYDVGQVLDNPDSDTE